MRRGNVVRKGVGSLVGSRSADRGGPGVWYVGETPRFRVRVRVIKKLAPKCHQKERRSTKLSSTGAKQNDLQKHGSPSQKTIQIPSSNKSLIPPSISTSLTLPTQIATTSPISSPHQLQHHGTPNSPIYRHG